MSGPKHTPGPWGYEASQFGGLEVAPYNEDGELDWDREVCVTADENEANARLIAAAPRLAAALKEIAHGAPTIMPTGLVEREHWRLAKVARAALGEAGVTDDA